MQIIFTKRCSHNLFFISQ